MELSEINITERDLVEFRNGIKFIEGGEICLISTFKSAWLFLNIFKRFNIGINYIRFNGFLTETERNNLLVTLNYLGSYFPGLPVHIKDSMVNFTKQLIDNKKPVLLNEYLKEILSTLPLLKKHSAVNSNGILIDQIFKTFTIFWFC